MPWIVLGDFNVVKDAKEKAGGQGIDKQAVLQFNECIETIEVTDLKYTGCLYTWNNRQSAEHRIHCKLDRVMVNEMWLSSFPHSEAFFPTATVSDHSSMTINIRASLKTGPKPFKFFNFWTKHKDFMKLVAEEWGKPIAGTPMYQLFYKLKHLKTALKAFNVKSYGDISNKVAAAKVELEEIQWKLQKSPTSSLIEEENKVLERYAQLARAEEEFYKQKARDNIIKAGDQNTSYFHRKVKAHCSKNKILSIMDNEGVRQEDYERVKATFIDYYKKLLGTSFDYPQGAKEFIKGIMQHSAPSELLSSLDLDVTEEEIKNTLFSLPDHKAPGPDGYTSHFFKQAWSIVGNDFMAAIKSFFTTGKLLKQVNATTIVLVPKVPNPSVVSDYRPISCCSTIYKCISKIIANRLKRIMPHIINSSQAAFVKGRSISDQILLMHELVRNYHRSNLSPRSALKIDLMKAFDSVSWDLLLDILHALQLPTKCQKWIEACITSPQFSISLNGSLEGYFTGAKGLRQGDPLSPYLFLLAMEFFSRLFSKHISDGHFTHHPKCLRPAITHICFADDLFILCAPNCTTFKLIHETLLEFHKYSGLKPNERKSKVYISGVSQAEKLSLCSILGFQLGELPVKYLGVPLISTKLKLEDCKELIEKITKRVTSWSSKCLSYAGRLVLIKSILFSTQIYWSFHFILPKKVCNSIEQILRRFLWSGAEMKKWGSKVAWNEVCLPKNEGGLGIRRIHEWNKASMLRHIWTLCTSNQSLWATWSKANLLKGKCFWEVKPPSDCSWNWRKILKLRSEATNLSKYKVGNGNSISLWYSNWHPKGPLIPKYGQRIAYDAGLPRNTKVSHIVRDMQWNWPFPNTWELREVVLDCPPNYQPNQTKDDELIWTASKTNCYTAAATWNAIREHAPKVHWHSLVWFPKHIPRHSFILWLAIKGKLTTKDKLAMWGVNVDPLCVLCGLCNETIDHLFFRCPFSAEVRKLIMHKCLISKPTLPWEDEVAWACGKFSGNSLCQKIRKLAWAAMVYHIWMERNAKVFNGHNPSITKIIKEIMHEVKVRCSYSFVKKASNTSIDLSNSWDIPYIAF